MNLLPIIESKRDGKSLSPSQLQELVAACTSGALPDYQLAAFLMAVLFRGMSPEETRALTLAMRDSGRVLKFPHDRRPLVDKHSTGGVGDKVSLPLAPLLACLDFRVPMISGRGLGITGGTLDKLDSIPGFRTDLKVERLVEVVQQVGCVITGQTDDMVPADKTLYALRDVTGTVPSIPLIVSSILSKKLAEGLQALVLDIKFGAAAFMPTPQKARELALAMVSLSRECGLPARALLTNMDSPLGLAAGNWLEVREAVTCLESAGGASRSADLMELVVSCAAHLLVQSRRHSDLAQARNQVEECLASGEPRRKWDEMIAAQGANLDVFYRKLALDHTAPIVLPLKAPASGILTRCNARIVGEVIRDLGGGRVTKTSAINHDVGVELETKPGEAVGRDDVLARIHAADERSAQNAAARLATAFEIADSPAPVRPLIQEVLG